MTPLFNEPQSLIPTLIKLKYDTTDKHQIAPGYTNFLTQFSVSLNNLVHAHISISCFFARKETVDIDILVTSRNGERKIMQSIRITSRPPSRIRN